MLVNIEINVFFSICPFTSSNSWPRRYCIESRIASHVEKFSLLFTSSSQYAWPMFYYTSCCTRMLIQRISRHRSPLNTSSFHSQSRSGRNPLDSVNCLCIIFSASCVNNQCWCKMRHTNISTHNTNSIWCMHYVVANQQQHQHREYITPEEHDMKNLWHHRNQPSLIEYIFKNEHLFLSSSRYTLCSPTQRGKQIKTYNL